MPRLMEITTPLGADVLLFHGMHAREELSRASEFQINLLSEKDNINPDDILGKNVTVTLEMPNDATRHFNGYVTRFSQGGTLGRYHRYRAEVRPWLWFLSRTADCRIFQDMTVPDIVKAVFGDHKTADFAMELTATYRKWTYCVQYRETDFNFVSRLLEEEGIYYYVRHSKGHNTLVLTDSSSKHKSAKGCEKLPFISAEKLSRPDIDHISSWDFSREIQPGVYAQDDYDFERPSVEIKTRKVLERSYTPSDYEIFDYPGHYVLAPDGQQIASTRIDEYGSQFEAANAVTNARGLSVGCALNVYGCPRADQNREYLVLSASYDLEYGEYESVPQPVGANYQCSFVAMSTRQQFRPRRLTPKPFVQGPQTAMVVGPDGDEIYTDKYGRVKVVFHWDRRGQEKKDENSSCWIRVSHPWAGKAWGGIAIPRIGQEVVVDFLEGDPDQPIITGRVYNAEQMPPYELPANMTQTGIKSRSSKSGTPDNFNEIRFEDKKGAEQVFIHAEKNQDIEVENDETHWVGHDRRKTIDHDESTHVEHDRNENVGNNETITIGKNRTESVGDNESITIGKNRTEDVGQNESITIGKSRTESVNENETVTIGKNRTESVGDNDSLNVGKKLAIQAGDQITIQTGAASITMKKDGTIVISGKNITIEGSGKINVKASSDVVIKGSKVLQN